MGKNIYDKALILLEHCVYIKYFQLYANEHLSIFNGVSNYSEILYSFSSSHELFDIKMVSSKNIILAQFVSNNTSDDQVLNWKIDYHPFCEEWIDMKNGYLKSPNHPEPYDNNVTCKWGIISVKDQYVLLNFVAFEVSY